MEATTTRRRATHPMSYYREMVKDMDDNQKLELASIRRSLILPWMLPPVTTAENSTQTIHIS